jgi:N6-L-threonylcarbamoyladenine synthase
VTRILAIETSCDETAASVVEDGTHVLSSVVSSQVDLHARYGGVVPELAGRAHLELLTPVVAQALVEAGVDGRKPAIDAVAVTAGPGLIGALLVGVSAAKAYALAWDIPFVAVNHLEGHLAAAFLEEPDLPLPLVVLLASGGHTMLISMAAPGRYRLLGQTIDDAVGEAFDKVARLLGLGYPGGPAIDNLALQGDPKAVTLPRPLWGEGYDFSFSGLKTAVLTVLRKQPDLDPADVAASFQEAAVDVLIDKARRAALATEAKGLCLAGGVAANSLLRERALDVCIESGLSAFIPSRAMCTDNAAMIAAAAFPKLARRDFADFSVLAQANLTLA